MIIEQLDWDSKLFGYRVGRSFPEFLESSQFARDLLWIKNHDYRLIYIFPKDIQSRTVLLEKNISIADTRVTFEKCAGFQHKPVANTRQYATPDSYETIKKLALASGEYSRFNTDPLFSNNEFERLYTKWIDRSLSKEIASDVIVYTEENLVKGFVSYKKQGSESLIIGLIAIDHLCRNKGIGRTLMQYIENIAWESGLSKIVVSTQFSNFQASQFYASCGYTVTEKQDIFHLWI